MGNNNLKTTIEKLYKTEKILNQKVNEAKNINKILKQQNYNMLKEQNLVNELNTVLQNQLSNNNKEINDIIEENVRYKHNIKEISTK